ncbi:expressed unknown protein [Seminavis robusta]|uniref:Uncharacterized protein n=1 Tax=Seminavis robusta TaxID=568900 RepID=A0A9N8DX97_9STRA|nr:expressed unknown protein [Seminavis robusta]|eukprot:Sro342_g121700.1 n/a (163) ;mRNA; f:26725-27213
MKKPHSILKIQTQAESLYSSAVQDEKPPTSKCQCNVSFDITEIRVYPQMLDTSCEGAALTIGWEPVSTEVTTVQEYYLEHSSNLRSSDGKLRAMKPEHRISILINAGYSRDELYHHMVSFSLMEEEAKLQSKTIYSKLRKAALKFTGVGVAQKLSTGVNAAA